MAESRKVPRIDWGKYRGGRAAGRREAVAVLGDSLRELGCVRVQGYAEAAAGVAGGAALSAVAHGVLEALAAYFGLPETSFETAAAADLAAAAEGDPAAAADLLLLLFPEVPPGLAVRRPEGEWSEVSAHPGELLVVAGAALARLTAGRVVAPALRWPASGAGCWSLAVARGRPVEPLAAFAG